MESGKDSAFADGAPLCMDVVGRLVQRMAKSQYEACRPLFDSFGGFFDLFTSSEISKFSLYVCRATQLVLGCQRIDDCGIFFSNWRLQPRLASLGLRLEIHWPPEFYRLSSLFENPNPYGIISTSMLGIGLFLFLQKHLILGIMGAFAAIWGVFQSGSRNPVFTLFICIFCMLLIFSKKLKWHQLQKYQYLITLISVLLILSLGTLFFFENPLVNRLNPVIRDLSKINSITEILELDKLRSELYISVIDYLINNQNLLGTGPKTFEFLDDFSHLSQDQRYHAHNAWLTIWVEMGWVGLSLAFGFIASWFWKFRRASLCLWFSVLVLCIGQMLDYFIWQITFMTVQSLIFILMAASSNYGSSKDQ